MIRSGLDRVPDHRASGARAGVTGAHVLHGRDYSAPCLILAAGHGRRLSATGQPKPLVPVLGLSLIERTIATAAEAGITDFTVVTGHDARTVEPFAHRVAARRGLSITTVRNTEWRTGNGSSVLAARELLGDSFLLLMADDVFDSTIIDLLLDHGPRAQGIVAAADFRIGAATRTVSADATKLLVQDQHVVTIGKRLREYNAFDTGIFLCSPALFAAVAASMRGGDTTLSGGIRVLAESRRVDAIDIGDRMWVDVDTPHALRTARRALRQNLSKPNDGVVSRVLNRKISTRLITPALLQVLPSFTPNQVSALGFVVAIGAAVSFGLRSPVLAGAAVLLASVLDGSDGEIARLKKLASPLGSFVDAVLDRYADAVMLVGAGFYAAIAGAAGAGSGARWNTVVALATSWAVTGVLMVSYTSAKSMVDLAYRYRGRWIAAGRGRDARLLVLALGAWLSLLAPIALLVALVVIGIMANTAVAARVITSWSLSQPKRSLSDVRAVVFDFDGTLVDSMPFLTRTATKISAERAWFATKHGVVTRRR